MVVKMCCVRAGPVPTRTAQHSRHHKTFRRLHCSGDLAAVRRQAEKTAAGEAERGGRDASAPGR